jgi:two-component system NarL family response regulator
MKALLVDDHPLITQGLASCLAETDRFTNVEKAVSLAEAKQLINESPPLPDLVVLDIQLDGENGLDLIPFLKKLCKSRKVPLPKILICSMHGDSVRIHTAIGMGACGFISKANPKTELLRAVDTVMRSEFYISDELAELLKKAPDTVSKFTKREMEVLQLIKQNKTNSEIAEAMGLSVRTVENHTSSIYLKTGVTAREGLLKL